MARTPLVAFCNIPLRHGIDAVFEEKFSLESLMAHSAFRRTDDNEGIQKLASAI